MADHQTKSPDMEIVVPGLDLNALTAASTARHKHFRNGKGEPFDGDRWSLGDWICALTGEVGELANYVKKVQRGDFSLEEARQPIEEELADVLIYLAIVAARCGVDLSGATVRKFNKVSLRVKAPVTLLRHSVLHIVPPTPPDFDIDAAVDRDLAGRAAAARESGV